MGASQIIHLGPYIIVPTQKRVKNVLKLVCKKNKNHHFPSNASFCPQCGGEIIATTMEEMMNYSAQDCLFEKSEFVDSLCFFDDLLYSNIELKGGLNIEIDSYKSNEYNIPSDSIRENDMVAFKTQFEKELAFLTEHGFEIKYYWGLCINWW